MEARPRKSSSRIPSMDETSGLISSTTSSSRSRSVPHVDIDEVLYMAGGFGRFQIIATIALMFLVITFGFHFTFSVFIGAGETSKSGMKNIVMRGWRYLTSCLIKYLARLFLQLWDISRLIIWYVLRKMSMLSTMSFLELRGVSQEWPKLFSDKPFPFSSLTF